jgi:hypothetical protein
MIGEVGVVVVILFTMLLIIYRIYKCRSSSIKITVAVFDSEGNPLGDAYVMLKSDDRKVAEGYTNEYGICILKADVKFPLKLIVDKDEYEMFESMLRENRAIVKLEKAEFVKLTIRVVNENSKPIDDAEVQVYLEGILKGKKTTVNGLAEFELKKGRYSVVVAKKGFKRTTVDIYVDEDREVDIALLEKKGILRITVVDEFRKPLNGIKVMVNDISMYTNEDGVVEMEIPVGNHAVGVLDPDGIYEKVKLDIVVEEGSSNDVVVVLKIATFYDVNEKYRDAVNEIEAKVVKAVSALPSEWDKTIPNFIKSLCLTLIEFAKRVPVKSKLSAWDVLSSIKSVCDLLVEEIRRPEYKPLYVKGTHTLDFDVKFSKYYEEFESIVRNPDTTKCKSVEDKVRRVDGLITTRMNEVNIILPANTWKIAKNLVRSNRAIDCFIANVLLDYVEEMLTGEISIRLKR